MKKLWILFVLILIGCMAKPIYYELPAAPGFRMHEKSHLSSLADGDIALVEDVSDGCATKYTLMSDIGTYLGATFQPLEATLTDIADGTIAENLVNTANPWAANEVADDINIDSADKITALSVYTGTTSLEETTAADDSGAYIIGVYDEFANSNNDDIQGVLNDLDAALDLRCLKSIFGTSIGTGILLDGAVLKASTILQKYHGVDPSATALLFLADGNATAMRATIECGSAATRDAEDTLTDGSNLPDGAAIKTYGDTNWSASGGDPGKRYAADYGFSTAESAVNNSTYFDNAVTAMSAGEVLIIPEGTSKINNVVFDPPSGCGLICYGELESNASGTAFTIGVADGSAQRNYYDIQRLRVNSESIDRSAGRIGILVKNVNYSDIEIRECRRFEIGVKFFGTNSTGCCYNEVHLGMIYNNKYGLHLDAESNGWTNENSFYGGSYGWQSNTDATGFRHIWIDYYATHPINSNKFYSSSLEGNPTTATSTTVGIYNEGRYNYFYSPRFEMGSNCTIVNFTSNTMFNVVFFGYAMMDLTTKNLTDNGSTNNFFGHYLTYLTTDIETTKSIKGRTKMGVDVTGNTNHDTDELHNVFYQVTAVSIISLDAAADAGYGATATYFVRDAESVSIDPTATEKINLAGTPGGAGKKITSTGAAGDVITLIATTDADGSGTDGWIAPTNPSSWTMES